LDDFAVHQRDRQIPSLLAADRRRDFCSGAAECVYNISEHTVPPRQRRLGSSGLRRDLMAFLRRPYTDPYLLARRYQIRREKLFASILVHLGGALVLCLAWTSAGVLLALPLNRRPPQEAFLRYYLSWTLANLPWSVFLYFTVLGSIFAFTYYREARERESQQRGSRHNSPKQGWGRCECS